MEGPVSKYLLIHIILAVLVVAFTGVLVGGFVQENLGQDFMEAIEDAQGNNLGVRYNIRSIVFLFLVFAIPLLVLAALALETIRYTISSLWKLKLRAYSSRRGH
jgi:hypothetical protein